MFNKLLKHLALLEIGHDKLETHWMKTNLNQDFHRFFFQFQFAKLQGFLSKKILFCFLKSSSNFMIVPVSILVVMQLEILKLFLKLLSELVRLFSLLQPLSPIIVMQ